MKIAFLTNGKGWGHAVRDIELSKILIDIIPGVKITYFSYSDGVCAYRKHNIPVIDTFQDDNYAFSKLKQLSPELIIADEEISNLSIITRSFSHVIFITNYLSLISDEIISKIFRCDLVLYCSMEETIPEKLRNNPKLKVIGDPVYWKNSKSNASPSVINPSQIGITLGGCSSLAARIENEQLLYQLSKVSPMGYKFKIINESVTPANYCWMNSWQQEPRTSTLPTSLASCKLVLCRGGGTVWELASTLSANTYVLVIPFSPKVNPLEEIYAAKYKEAAIIDDLCYIHLDIDELDANKCSKYDYTCCLGSWEIESDLDINEKIMFINGVLHAVF